MKAWRVIFAARKILHQSLCQQANNSNPKNCPFHTFLFEEPCLLTQCILFYRHRGYEL